MGRACSIYEKQARCIQDFSGEPEGRRPLGRPRHRWEDIIMDLGEVGWGRKHGLDQFGSGQEQVVGSCECRNKPSGSIKCKKFLE
jgi:hypothetical protein